MSSSKVPVFFSDSNQTWTFLTDFRKILKYQLSRNPPVGAEFFHADRSTDGHDDANSRFSQFCERGTENGNNRSENTCALLYSVPYHPYWQKEEARGLVLLEYDVGFNDSLK